MSTPTTSADDDSIDIPVPVLPSTEETETLAATAPGPPSPLLQETAVAQVGTYEFEHEYSQEEEETLRRIASAFKEEFNGKIFSNKADLKAHLDEFGRPFGVYISTTADRRFSCSRSSRSGKSKSTITQIRNVNSALLCGCPMKCSFTYTIPSYPDPEKLGVKRRDAKYKV